MYITSNNWIYYGRLLNDSLAIVKSIVAKAVYNLPINAGLIGYVKGSPDPNASQLKEWI